MKLLNLIANILLIIGGINLGLIGIAHMDIVGKILSHNIGIIRVLYALIGIAAVVKVVLLTAYNKALQK
ncbi:MAG: DUF378 domain-containing protein [Verrucomicrobia bacterium]|nr:DUF378 domain-containing protein [Verrucomicrobiota bacterium]